jgi:hypothetical protein
MLGGRVNALCTPGLEPPPPAHSTAQRQPDLPVVLSQSGDVPLVLIRQNPVAVVIDQAHVILLVAS